MNDGRESGTRRAATFVCSELTFSNFGSGSIVAGHVIIIIQLASEKTKLLLLIRLILGTPAPTLSKSEGMEAYDLCAWRT